MRLLSPFGGRIKERGFELQQFLIILPVFTNLRRSPSKGAQLNA
jgi:hypothetical protein